MTASSSPRRARLAMLTLSLLLAAGWASPAPAFDHAALAETALERHIRPSYGRLESAALALEQAMRALCAVPSGPNLKGAKAAFRQAVLAWSRVEQLRFGPVSKANRYERIAFWPDPKGIGRKQLTRALKGRDPALLEPDKLVKKSVALQGLTALELVLFGKGAEALSNTSDAGTFRCGYGHAIARNLAAISVEIIDAWSEAGAFSVLWLAPGPENPVYFDRTEPTRDLARAYIEGLERVRELKIAGPLGLGRKAGRRTKPAFWHSGLALAAITANLEGLYDLFVEGGLAVQLAVRKPGIVMSVRGELERVLALARAIKNPDGRSLSDPDMEEQLIQMGFPLKSARETAGALLAEAAGLPIRFNDSDAN